MSRFIHSTSADKYFDKCPQQFWLYQSGAERGETPGHFAFGITVHRVMELYLNHCIGLGRRSDKAMIPQMIDSAVRETRLSMSRYDEVCAVVESFLSCYEIDVEHSIAREGGIAFDDELNLLEWSDALEYGSGAAPMTRKGSAMWRCKLDHALLFPEDQTLLIEDYKTNVYVPSQSEVEDPSSAWYHQASRYAWAASRGLYAAEVVKVDFLFMRRTAYGRVLRRSLTFLRDTIAEIERQILRGVAFKEATREFEATSGEHCANCAFRDTACPIPQTAVTDGRSLMYRYLFDEVEQAQRREKLKELIAEYGFDGYLGDLRASFEQGEEKIPDMERVWQALLAEGIEKPWAVMSFSATAAKRALDKDQAERVIEAAYDPGITVRFNVHQKKEALVELARQRGIDTTKQGKTKRVEKSSAELALELAAIADADAREVA